MQNYKSEKVNLLAGEESGIINIGALSLGKKSNKSPIVLKPEIFTKINLKNFDYLILISTFSILFSAVYVLYHLHQNFDDLHFINIDTSFGFGFYLAGLALLIIKISFLIFILVNFLRYKPVQSVADELLPFCTVIVPAYNEGSLVWETLISLAKSDYPHDRLQIISIDDGSLDDTWDWMLKAKAELGARLTLLQQPVNKGKRHALYRGFKLATGDIFITVDSDSIVKPNTLRNMVSPFIVNEQCGAVAGNVRVLNNQKAIIPRMLNVSFVFSFEFVRSAQSVLGSVLCTPGALAAYRKEAVLNCLPEWINQKFMGKTSDIGEDRAMTNMILKQGLHVLFQRNAYVFTNIPEKYKNLYKMFIRWERSNVRENIMMSKFAFGNFRDGSKTGSRILLLNQWFKVLLAYPMIILMFTFLYLKPLLFMTTALVSILIFSSIQAIFFAKRHNVSESLWAYPYSLFYTFSLFWITPYAIATAGRKGWLTRVLPKNNE